MNFHLGELIYSDLYTQYILILIKSLGYTSLIRHPSFLTDHLQIRLVGINGHIIYPILSTAMIAMTATRWSPKATPAVYG